VYDRSQHDALCYVCVVLLFRSLEEERKGKKD